MATLKTHVTLNSGYKIPLVGYGTYQGKDFDHNSDHLIKVFTFALKSGYTHIDTADLYKVHKEVGEAIKLSGIPRENLFVTTKLWGTDHANPSESLDRCLKELGLDYVDLFLMHWPQTLDANHNALPHPTPTETWKLMEPLVETGKVRSIGVSNFSEKTLEPLLKEAKIVPAVNQIEINPFLPQHEFVKYCKDKNIHVTAWSPLSRGLSQIFNHEALTSVAKKHHATVAQVILSWLVSKDISVLPRSTNEERIKENLSLIQLEKDEIDKIDNMHKDYKGKTRMVLSVGPGEKFLGWTYEEYGW